MDTLKKTLLKKFRYMESTGKSQYIYANVNDLVAFIKEFKNKME